MSLFSISWICCTGLNQAFFRRHVQFAYIKLLWELYLGRIHLSKCDRYPGVPAKAGREGVTKLALRDELALEIRLDFS